MKTIGPYTIRGLLGKGGMGRVYKVTLPVIEKIVALKRLEPDPVLVGLMGEERIKAQFVHEAKVMADLRHPNILPVIGYAEIEDTPCYLMEYFCRNLGGVIGETYITEAPSRVIRIDRAAAVVRGILNGLERLHYDGIVHRDIKPFNILLTDRDTVKICDFGLSKLRGEILDRPDNLNVGSPFYMAREQEKDPESARPSADLFSVGVIFYRMLTGLLPGEDFAPPSFYNPDLNRRWDAFFKTALERDPRRRFQDAGTMRREMDDLFHAWDMEREKQCRIGGQSTPQSRQREAETAFSSERVRKTPLKVRPKDAPSVFQTDALWRPLVYMRHGFAMHREGVVRDRATGLIWQQAGSPYPLSWKRARGYIERLNQERFAGCGRWRMPTVDELMTLLSPTPSGGDFCMEPVFDATQRWLWSADRRSFTAAYYVNMEMGFVSWHDFTGFFHVKGVCTGGIEQGV